MKEISKKIIAIFVIMLMIINSSLLTIISVAAEDIKNVLDKSKAEVKNEINIEKYVNYSFEDNKGILLKLDLKTGIEYKEDQEYKAIKQTKTELTAPQINGEFPEKVELQAISTKATNGSDTAKDYDYKYDSNTGKIAIVVQNKEDDNHNIYTEKVDGARDNYKLNLYYSSNCYNENKEKRTIEVTGNVKEVLNTDDSAEISGDINASGEVTENISGLVSADIVSGQIYNGNINANINNGTKNPTTYSETTNINVDYESISDKIEITEDDFDAMAEKAMELIGGNIRRFVARRTDLEAAEAMLTGSLFAGIAFSFARLGNVHAMSHPVSAFFDVPHGVANAVLLPVIAEYNALADHGRYLTIYNYISPIPAYEDEFEPLMLVDAIRELNEDIGIPENLTTAIRQAAKGREVSDEEIESRIDAMADDAMKSGNIAVNPRSSQKRDIVELYHKAI